MRLATATLLGFEDDHLIDLGHRHQETRLARVTRLTTPTALPWRATGTLRLGRIARRRA